VYVGSGQMSESASDRKPRRCHPWAVTWVSGSAVDAGWLSYTTPSLWKVVHGDESFVGRSEREKKFFCMENRLESRAVVYVEVWCGDH
jgi:hypothetical protein